MRINISLDEKLLKQLDDLCGKLHYTRSEYLRSLIRKEGFTERVYPGIHEAEEEVKPSPVAQEGTPKKLNVGSLIKEQSKKPMFCKKHSGSRIGDIYTCGCKV